MKNFYHWLEMQQRSLPFMQTPRIGLEQAKGMIGPVYHGTDKHDIIADRGFQVFVGLPREGNIANGYEFKSYINNIPPPIHHLGFGIYFTTNKTIAKKYNHGTTKRLATYYIDAPRTTSINWGALNTMMKWWQANGYDMPPVTDWTDPAQKQQWVRSTINLTNHLKAKYDAIWYKGKGFGKLLDGDQLVVYDATNIYELDMSLTKGDDIGGIAVKTGDRFLVKGTDRTTAVVVSVRDTKNKYTGDLWDNIVGPSSHFLQVTKFKADPSYEAKYRHLLEKEILNSEWLKTRMQNAPDMSAEDHLERAVNHLLYNFSNFPSALVGRVLNKGERI